jgi:hypothetical protein
MDYGLGLVVAAMARTAAAASLKIDVGIRLVGRGTVATTPVPLAGTVRANRRIRWTSKSRP